MDMCQSLLYGLHSGCQGNSKDTQDSRHKLHILEIAIGYGYLGRGIAWRGINITGSSGQLAEEVSALLAGTVVSPPLPGNK